MHWTILSEEEVFADASTANSSPESSQVEEIVMGPARLILNRQRNGQATITRLISPRMSDYLRPEWQPGQPYQG